MTSRAHHASGNARDQANRDPNDWNITGADAVWPLIEVEKLAGRLWEPCCGDGAISRVLELSGCRVVSTDLVDRGFGRGGVDVLSVRRPLAPKVVTNPPYKDELPWRIARHLLQIGVRYVALLVHLARLQGEDRHSFFKETRLSRAIVLGHRPHVRRAGYRGKDQQMMQYQWLIWDVDRPGHVDARGHYHCELVLP